MKSFIIALLCFSLTTLSYSQDKKAKESGNENLKMEELPEVVVKSAGKEFSMYLPDKNPDLKVQKLENEFIAYDIGKDYEGHEEYLLILEIKNGSLVATYNETGKLTSVVENYKDVKLPSAVIYSVYKKFPGWAIVNDKFLYTQEDGDVVKKQYNLKIKKNNEIRKLVVHPDGEIVEGGNSAAK